MSWCEKGSADLARSLYEDMAKVIQHMDEIKPSGEFNAQQHFGILPSPARCGAVRCAETTVMYGNRPKSLQTRTRGVSCSCSGTIGSGESMQTVPQMSPLTPNVVAEAVIDLDAIADNVRVLRDRSGSAEVMAVVKADGYGHGATCVSRTALAAGATLNWAIYEALALRS